MICSQMIATRSEIVAENGLVTGGHPAEAEAGVSVLRQGGNAIDAVVAAAFAGFVVEPAACGIGGYGRLAMYIGERREFITIDHYARAPAAARPDMFAIDWTSPVKYNGFPPTIGAKAERGALAIAVPGAVAGLCAAHDMFGRLPLAQVLEPAILAAEAGTPITWDLQLAIVDRLADIRAAPLLADFLLRDGSLPKRASQFVLAERLEQSELAATLREIADRGHAGFYGGRTAEAIERECARNGGILTAADLAAYKPRIMRENPASYRGHSYISAYDQVSYEALNILDQFDLKKFGPDSAEYRHLMAEALGHAYVDNLVYYGDPDFARSPVNGLASRTFAAERAANIRMERAAPRPISQGDPWLHETATQRLDQQPSDLSVGGIAGTSQMAAADREGNLVTLCTSCSNAFGSLVLVPGTGIILNNAMQNFDPRPNHPNCIQPGKMPIFAAPVVVAARDDRAVFGACGSGGYRITTGVLHTMVHALDFGLGLQAAVDAPRVHCQGSTTFVDARIPVEVRDRLTAMGHRLAVQESTPDGDVYGWFGRVNAIQIDPDTKLMSAGSGPAWGTAAAGF